MADVKQLIWGVYAAAAVSGAYLLAITMLAITIGGSSWKPGRYGAAVAWLYLSGGVLTLVLLLLVGLLALTGFEGLFLAFHRISFSNDLWQLNQKHRLPFDDVFRRRSGSTPRCEWPEAL